MNGLEMPKIVCEKCGYMWVPRVPSPKKCPRCGCRLGKLAAS